MGIIVFYSLRKIINKTGTSSKRIIDAFTALTYPRLPDSLWDPLYKYYTADFSGESFMLNPRELLRFSFKYTYKEVAEYICLASYRNYGHCSVTGEKHLDLLHSPVNEDTINNNRLLCIKDKRIYFYYEEVINRRNKLWH
jgi:hypothetical protein